MILGWSFVPCCEGGDVLTFVRADPTPYVVNGTVLYNDKCYKILSIAWPRQAPSGTPIEPTFGGNASDAGGTYLPDTAYRIITETPCEGEQCPDCNPPIVCYYVENCFDAGLNFNALLSNDTALALGNTYSISSENTILDGADFNNCWNITETTCEVEPTITLDITAAYDNCAACELIEVPPCYSLTNCETQVITYYSGALLADYVGQTIQIIINDIVNCFTVEEAQCTDPLQPPFDLTIEGCYDTCESCLPLPVPVKTPNLRAVLPGYETALCDPEKVEKIKCTFADLMYQEAMSRRFDIKFCCPKDLYTWQLRNEKINLDLTKIVNPTPDACNPICKTYEYEFAAGETGNISYTDCTEVAVVTDVLESAEPQRFQFCALDYPGVTINITNSLGQVTNTFTIQPTEQECIVP